MKFCTECGNRVSSRPVAHDSHQRYVCDTCSLVHYQNPRVLVAAAVFWRGKLLMCRRAHEPALGKWVTPSGYLECGETLQEAAARETFEEAGVSLDPAKMELYAIVNAPDIDQVRVLFRIDLLEELTVKPGPESLEALFMSEEQIREIDLAWPASSRRATQMLFAQHRTGNFDIHLMSVGARYPNSLNARSYPIAQSGPKRGTSPGTGDRG